jgi:hypothetical protein
LAWMFLAWKSFLLQPEYQALGISLSYTTGAVRFVLRGFQNGWWPQVSWKRPSPNPMFLEHIGSIRPVFSKRPGTTMLFRPPINWKTILVSDWLENINPTVFPTHLGNAPHAVITLIWKPFCFQIVGGTAR